MRTNCTARIPNLTLQDTEKTTITLIDIPYPSEKIKEEKRAERIRKYQQVSFELQKRREGEELESTTREMQKTILWQRETILRKILSALLT